jgi:hypothetical protein
VKIDMRVDLLLLTTMVCKVCLALWNSNGGASGTRGWERLGSKDGWEKKKTSRRSLCWMVLDGWFSGRNFGWRLDCRLLGRRSCGRFGRDSCRRFGFKYDRRNDGWVETNGGQHERWRFRGRASATEDYRGLEFTNTNWRGKGTVNTGIFG